MRKKWLSEAPPGFKIAVSVSPNGKKSEVIVANEDVLRIRLKAPPVDGKANEELIYYIASKLNLPKSSVKIAHGLTSRRKLLEIYAPLLTRQNIEDFLGNTAN
jgi:hypothetical protein